VPAGHAGGGPLKEQVDREVESEVEIEPDMVVKAIATEALARKMFQVFHGQPLTRGIKDELNSLSLAQAYEVQTRVIAMRVREGERIIGWKVGCTSRAIQGQFGLRQPISGRLMHPHIYHDGSSLALVNFVGCAVEPEIVIRLGKDLSGEVDENSAAHAIAAIAPGIEIHSYRFLTKTPTHRELIASNGIHAGLVVGSERSFCEEIDLAMEGVGIWLNGRLQASGIGAEVMSGGPLDSLRWLARHAHERGEILRAGDLIIPGSAVRLIRLRAGDRVEARFTRLGKCAAVVI
jgi:2-keto-4-pentenoate hydratase